MQKDSEQALRHSLEGHRSCWQCAMIQANVSLAVWRKQNSSSVLHQKLVLLTSFLHVYNIGLSSYFVTILFLFYTHKYRFIYFFILVSIAHFEHKSNSLWVISAELKYKKIREDKASIWNWASTRNVSIQKKKNWRLPGRLKCLCCASTEAAAFQLPRESR